MLGVGAIIEHRQTLLIMHYNHGRLMDISDLYSAQSTIENGVESMKHHEGELVRSTSMCCSRNSFLGER